MRILLASSEAHPYSKTGGLADMVGALGRYLALEGEDVSLITPLYSKIRDKFPRVAKTDIEIELPLGSRTIRANVWRDSQPEGLEVYFIDQPEFYQRAALYQENGRDFPDNAERFIFFSKCVAYLARHLPDPPEIVHVHDWQAALAPLLILHEKLHGDWWHPPSTCLTIHNLAFQGLFPASAYAFTNLPWNYFNPHGVEFYGSFNCLKAGIVFSDLVTTVSPRYAREIATPEYGCGLDGLLRSRQNSVVGILNGVDYSEWNTIENPHLKTAFDAELISAKVEEKRFLQLEMGLPPRPDVPLFGTVTRLSDQKGLDIQLPALEEMVSAPLQFALLGSGSPDYEEAFRRLAQRYPEKVAVRIGFDAGLAHRIEAGSDFFLMPSRFEPCGLNQMYSLRYGSIPIVRATGGLDDTVADARESPQLANGIKFSEYTSRALAKAIRKALVLYQHPEVLHHYRRNGMEADFSWERTAAEYRELYARMQSGPATHSIRA